MEKETTLTGFEANTPISLSCGRLHPAHRRDVDCMSEEMGAEQDPLTVHIFVSFRNYRKTRGLERLPYDKKTKLG